MHDGVAHHLAQGSRRVVQLVDERPFAADLDCSNGSAHPLHHTVKKIADDPFDVLAALLGADRVRGSRLRHTRNLGQRTVTLRVSAE